MTVTDVEQFNGASCVPACLESILADLGRPESQTELFNRFPLECSEGRNDRPDGTVSLRHIPSLLLGLNLGNHVRFGPASSVLPEVLHILETGGFILLATRAQDIHCVRVASAVLNESIDVMDPSPNATNPCRWSWNDLIEKQAWVVAIWNE